MRFYLDDLMTLESFREATVVAGDCGRRNKISAANILDTSMNFKYVQEESFVFYTTYSKDDQDKDFIKILETLSDYGIGALGIKKEQLASGLPEAVKNKADELCLPILALSENFYYSDLVDKIRSHIYCHGTNEFIDQNDIHVIFNNMANSKGLYGTVELLNRFTGFDALIVYGHEKLQCPLQKKIVEFNYDKTWDGSHLILTKNAIDTFDQEIHECTVHAQDVAYKCIATKLKYEDKVGYIWLFNKDRPFDESDYSLIRITTYWFDLISAKLFEMQAEKQQVRADIIRLLLSGTTEAVKEAIRKTQEKNLNLPEKASIMVIKHTLDNNKELIRRINNFFFGKFNQLAVVGLYGTDVVLLVSEDFGATVSLARSLHDYLVNKYPSGHFNLGIGRQRSFGEFIDSYQEARHANRIGYASDVDISHFEDINLYRLVPFAGQKNEMVRFYEDYYLPLKDYDDKHESDLVRTLSIFLNSGCSYSATAEALHFHRNTIRYRIHMVEKLCGVDIRTLDGIISLGMALKLAPLIKDGKMIYDNL